MLRCFAQLEQVHFGSQGGSLVSSNKQEESTPLEVEVTIGDVRGLGDRRYAFAYTTQNGSLPEGTPITFSMKYWRGKGEAQKGQVVILREVQMFAKGWRAFDARPVPLATRNKQEVGGES
jgi:hypothetical protein